MNSVEVSNDSPSEWDSFLAHILILVNSLFNNTNVTEEEYDQYGSIQVRGTAWYSVDVRVPRTFHKKKTIYSSTETEEYVVSL